MDEARVEPFEKYSDQYENWFKRNNYAYGSELKAISEQLPINENGIEIGVGSGRFAAPLGIKIGIDPSAKLGKIARGKGVGVIRGVAEKLPFCDSSFDFALITTTICFVDDIHSSFSEAYRILKPEGLLIIGFIDKESPVGRIYQQRRGDSAFYRIATFHTVDEVAFGLKAAGFKCMSITQTIFQALADMRDVEPAKKGYGEGSFVVIKATK